MLDQLSVTLERKGSAGESWLPESRLLKVVGREVLIILSMHFRCGGGFLVLSS